MLKSGLIFAAVVLSSLVFGRESYADAQHPSRAIEGGTRIRLVIDDTVVPAILNNSKSSQALISKLPYTATLYRGSSGYCGTIGDQLPVEDKDMHRGWLNGDIVYSVNTDELAIPYKKEEISENLYSGLVTLGVVETPFSTLDAFGGSITVRIELE
ncbi:cyclophilin-like fold protein [Breoghania sp.]|uniref:cyclophilin-like fold protein n=1 Tax=Breoghania sp. TaxID=2065378 RepID=UPI002AA87D77|nr:cyclophilin-like fold protein [Breoghania sp.]